ncbi:PAS domain S-box protein [Mucilaginibacter auburnensis]|uniref:histidine kinase n=1 Tax=Mucilaginibacter auburnensis TaxID=1457233 RepID=A0A2H9VU58_9SPHI|nr:PAS domain S-box protein [Mucilaginibacter auburnensis]PJJ84357.1 PAS domain S-box-containing protein [Mucilaginibacter auburnensis]
MVNHPDLHFQQNENIFRTLVEESATAVALYVGQEFIIKIANKAILKIYGKGNDVLDKPYFDVLPELRTQKVYQTLLDVYNTGIVYETTEERVDLVVDGKLSVFYFNFAFKPLKDAEGKVWGILNTGNDITELTLTRQQLAESEERTQFALDAAELGTWNLDPANQTVVWDKRCQFLFGFRKNAIAYADVLACVHPDDVERVKKAVSASIDPVLNQLYDVRFRVVGPNAELLHWVRSIGRAYFDDKGICIRFAGTIQDITREMEVNKEQQKLLSLVENTDEAIGITDLEGNVTYLNKAGYEILGLEKTEDIHRPAADFFANLPEDTRAAAEAILTTGKWEGERYYRNFKTGEVIPIYLKAFRIDGHYTGKPIAMASVARDLRPEMEARNEQNKLIALIENSSDFIALTDIDTNMVTYVNRAGKEMVGLDPDEPVYRKNTDFLMPNEQDRVGDDIYAKVRKDGKWTAQLTYRHFKTGEPIPAFVTSVNINDPVTGKPIGRGGVARDLRREIEDKKALVESEHLLQNITRAAPIALWMSDEQGNINYVNQTWLDWTGHTFNQSCGISWLDALAPDDRDKTYNKFIADLTERRPFEATFKVINTNGNQRWCFASGNPQYRSDGSFAGYISACTDVTEKNLAEQQLFLKNEELNEQIKQFEFVTGFMPVQLWITTPDGDLDYANDRALDYFGVDLDEIIGPKWILTIHPDDREMCSAAFTRSLITGDAYQCEFRLKDRYGNYKWHLARALPYTSEGKIVKWFGTNTDIDEQKRLERQKDDFLGIASHELKTPVTSIKAYTQVLGAMLKAEGEQKKAAMVARMDAQINRLTALIGDLLDVTKINSGKLQFNRTRFNFTDALKEAVEDLQHITQKHQLITNFTEVGEIFADRDRISQVITNLITNAIKYSPNSERIIVTSEKRENEVTVSVRDFGIGIAPDKRNRVFEQFYRVSGDKQHTFPGLGLGLYISSEIIKREGGRIWVNSIEGEGSDFCFALPVDHNSIIY